MQTPCQWRGVFCFYNNKILPEFLKIIRRKVCLKLRETKETRQNKRAKLSKNNGFSHLSG